MIKINNKWKHTEKEKEKIRKYHNDKNTKLYKEKNKKISLKLIGRKNPMSNETKRKLSIIHKNNPSLGMLGKKHTKKTKIKMRLNHRKNNSIEEKIKVSKTMKKWWKKNRKSEKVKEMLNKKKISMKGKLAGKKHPNWKGGKSFEPYSIDWTETLKRSIRERDNYICRKCKKTQKQNKKKLDVHHIDYNKQNCNPDNLISLCMKCHRKEVQK